MRDMFDRALATHLEVLEKMRKDEQLFSQLLELVRLTRESLHNGGKVLFAGNGGSAADAQHLAAEFTGKFYKNRPPLFAEALHCNSSYLTAVANDFSYEEIYSRLVQGIGRQGDILFGISTSGNSKNILKAFETAKALKIVTVGMTGLGGGLMKNLSNYCFEVPSTDTPRIQEAHILIGHIYCQLVEEAMFPDD